MSEPSCDEEATFKVACQIQSPQGRALYLKQVCGQDPVAFGRIMALLKVYDDESHFLCSPPPGLERTLGMPPVTEKPGDTIGHYRLLQEIGQGGMGVVYMAEQTEPVRRKVALKIIKPGMDTRQVIARFEAERQALSLMDHPNIARVLDAGATDSGRPFFVMELVKGQPITQYCDEHQLTPRQRLEMLLPVCQAIQHAHQKGIIHRDIKPTNVLVAEYDDRPVPKVIDFGVAKATSQKLTEKTLFTEYGQLVGTLDYMSPEQAKLNQMDIDTRSDIYSLGVLLYELLTGDTPFDSARLRSAAFEEMMRIIREEDPPKPSTRLSTSQMLASVSANRKMEPRKLSTLVRGELDWIVMKALDKDRGRRYETASGFAADLQRYLDNEPVDACPPSAAYRFRKLVRRNKVALATTAFIAAALIVGTLVSTWQAVRAMRAEDLAQTRLDAETVARNEAEVARTEESAQRTKAIHQEQIANDQKDQAERSERLARRQLYAANMNLAQQAWVMGDVAQVLELLEGQRPLPENEDLRGFEWYYLWRMCHRGLVQTFGGHRQGIQSIAFSAEGRCLASASWDGTVKLWDPSTGQLRGVCREPLLTAMALSPDGTTVATGGRDGSIRISDAATGREYSRLTGHSEYVVALAFTPDGKTLVSNGHDTTVNVWDLSTSQKRLSLKLKAIPDWNRALALSPDGKRLAATYDNSTVKVWDVATGEEQIALKHIQVISVAFSPDGQTLATGTGNDFGSGRFPTIKLWELASGRETASILGPLGWVFSLVFSSDAKSLAWGTGGGTAICLDLDTRQQHSLPHMKAVGSVAFSPDGKRLATGSEDGSVKMWDVAQLQHASEEGEILRINNPLSLAISPDGMILATGLGLGGPPVTADDNSVAADKLHMTRNVKLWNLQTCQEVGAFEATEGFVHAVAFSPDGKTLAYGNPDKTIPLWRWNQGQWEQGPILRGHTQKIQALAFSPNGQTVVSASDSWPIQSPGELIVWNAKTGDQLATPGRSGSLIRGWLKAVTFTPDGRALISGSFDRKVILWDTATWQARLILNVSFPVEGLACSSGGKILAAVGSQNHSTVGRFWEWDGSTWKPRASFSGPGGSPRSAAFSPNGKTFMTTGEDGTLGLWDPLTGQQRVALKGHGSLVWDADFSPDGDTLVSVSNDKTIRIWRAATEQEVLAQSSIDPALQKATLLFDRAVANSIEGRHQEALNDYSRCLDLDPENVLAQNNLAWLLASCPDLKLRDPRRAVELAKQAVAGAPEEATHWNTLGVAHDRKGEWKAAIESLEKAESLAPGKYEAYNGFFLAMAHWQLGEKEEARKWYDQAVAWMEKNKPEDAELLRFRQEAAELLGITEAKPETKK